jgi:hypothetical protein
VASRVRTRADVDLSESMLFSGYEGFKTVQTTVPLL